MNTEVIGSLLRYALIALGGWLGIGGLLDAETVNALGGALITLGTTAYMMWKRWSTKVVPAA